MTDWLAHVGDVGFERCIGPMSVFERFRQALRTQVTDDQWEKIKPRIAEENLHNIRVVSVGFLVMMLIMLLFSPLSPSMALARPLYLTMAVCSVVVYQTALHIKPTSGRAIRILTYTMVSLLLGYATILGTVFEAGQVATAFPAFVLVSPLLFTDRRRNIIRCIIIHTVFFIGMLLAFDDSWMIADDIINSCLFSTISIGINSYMLNVKLKQEYTQLKLAELSSQDLLTGIKNRNANEQALPSYPGRCRMSLGCIFADLNGLHELNEVKGHAAGDSSLQYVSHALKRTFGEKDAYRIGGDEFVVFVCDPEAGEIEDRIDEVRRITEERGCHVSLGISVQKVPHIDMGEIVMRAERHMYRDKRRYYQRTGFDRRGTRD